MDKGQWEEEGPTGKPIERSGGQPHVCFQTKLNDLNFGSRHH